MKSPVPVLALAVLLLSALALSAAAQPPAAPSKPAGTVVEQMRSLDGAFREIASAVAVGDGSRLVKALAPVHGIMKKTHDDVHAGIASLPKNADRPDDFSRRTESFRAQISALDRAGQRDDHEAMLMITKQLLESCVSCHRTFRD